MSHFDRPPSGFRRSRTSKGVLKPTATALQAQRDRAENRDLKARMQALIERFDAMENAKQQAEDTEK